VWVLLLGKDARYLVKVEDSDIHTKDGIIRIEDIKNKKFGSKVRTHLGKEFVIVKPNWIDFFEKAKRLQQVILPKDFSLILSKVGIERGWKVIDIGLGSGWLTIFLAKHIYPGKVYAYEKDERAIEISKKNFELFGIKNVIIRKKDATLGLKEKNVDLITIDIQDVKKVIKYAYSSLKEGGWLVIYSPHVNQVIEVREELKNYKFTQIETVENLVREWQYTLTLRPKTKGILHTVFLTFARKIE
jgi:tRNA (adenine57-N1/adenine58-N1)-methyltransferase